MVENIVFILGFFILFYVFLLIYDISSLYQRKKQSKIEKKRKEKLCKLIQEKEQNKEAKKSHKKLYNKLKHLSYLSSFCSLLEENITIEQKKLRDIVAQEVYTNLFVSLSNFYIKKDNLSSAYYAYVLRFIKIQSPEINDFLYKCLSSKSVYSVENALLAFYSFGEVDSIIDAYLFMSRKNVEYGHKLVADGLLNFNGSKEELCSKLYEKFDRFLESFQIGFLTYFRQCQYDLKKELYDRIEQNQMTKEITIEMIRYYSKVNYKKIAALLLERLENNYYKDFEYDVVMIQTLAAYPGKETIQVLKKCLSNTNYYVRYNAAKSLNGMTDLRKVIDLEDPFAKEMLASFIGEV